MKERGTAGLMNKVSIVIPMYYDENKALQITEEGKKKLMVIQEALKNVL